MKGIKIPTVGAYEVIELGEPMYKSLQAAIGGYAEIVHPRGLPRPYCMMVDEEGFLKKKPKNQVGSYLYETHIHNQPIVGDIVIVKVGDTPEGSDTVGLSDDDIAKLMQFISEIKARI